MPLGEELNLRLRLRTRMELEEKYQISARYGPLGAPPLIRICAHATLRARIAFIIASANVVSCDYQYLLLMGHPFIGMGFMAMEWPPTPQ